MVEQHDQNRNTYPASGNKTDFLTGDGRAGDGRGLSDVLMVTTTVRMVDGVHSNTTSAGPAEVHDQKEFTEIYTHEYALVTLGLVLVEGPACLQERLVDPSTTSDNTNGSPSTTADSLLRARGQPDAGLVLLRGVSNNGGVVAGGAGESATVTNLLLNVTDDGTFGEGRDGKDVADREGGLLSAVDVGTGVETLSGDESLLAELVAVGVAENDTGEGSTTAGR